MIYLVMTSIKKATELVLQIANIRTKEELTTWCGNEGLNKLYNFVKQITPDIWESIEHPECSVRYYYQLVLVGYKIYKP